ncbi:MAG: trypsin-like peptidase domain-containing protein [Sandaracinus sp.]|nr:trypsin-like peptidase domain-containing protein [Sandaracinus sp.]MCB9613503.1 trypsin-like peptidase domain-containing protein [Sandaracinus sp.]
MKAQEAARAVELRPLHELAVFATVRIQVSSSRWGTGWLLAQSGRPVVITNQHVVDGAARAPIRVLFYQGTDNAPVEVVARVARVSQRIDLAVLRLEADPPATARPIRMRTDTTVVRGERVVLGGNPSTFINGEATYLPFQTSEGVVTGHIASRAFEQCGAGRNCVVVDAASMHGSSGGPAFNLDGQLVGMLWGGPSLRGESAAVIEERGRRVVAYAQTAIANPAFAYLIHTRVMAEELQAMERR